MSQVKSLSKAIKRANAHPKAAVMPAVVLAALLGSSGAAVGACSPCSPCRGKCGASQQCKAKSNPCATKNPCAMQKCNPCAASGKCGAKANPCAAKRVTRPADYQPYTGDHAELAKLGEQLFNDPNLSSNGLSCASCHGDGAGYNASFTNEYPHAVDMAQNVFSLDKVHLDEMVQICMVQPMAAEPLPWDGKELAALTAYMRDVQMTLAANPCAAKTAKCAPCAGKNPCATRNPCASKNPCAGKNPCATKNPCAKKNPCGTKNPVATRNPCASKNPCAAKAA